MDVHVQYKFYVTQDVQEPPRDAVSVLVRPRILGCPDAELLASHLPRDQGRQVHLHGNQTRVLH